MTTSARPGSASGAGSESTPIPPSTPSGARRLVSIDALRAFAAIGVVFTHVAHHREGETAAQHAALLPLDFGYLGVTLFLVISGFCIHLAASVRPGGVLIQPNWVAFWKRRMYRLYPAYAIAALAAALVYFCLPPALYPEINRVTRLRPDILTHALMLHNLFASFPFSLGNGVFWTLGLEEQLYALYALYVVARRRYSPVSLTLACLGISLLWRWGVVVPFGSRTLGTVPFALGSWWTWPFGWWFCWLLGALAAEVYCGVITIPKLWSDSRFALALAVFGVAINQLTLGQVGWSHFALNALHGSALWWLLFQLLPQCSELAFGVCFFILINSRVGREQTRELAPSWHRAAALGRISYSLYLTHVPLVIVGEELLVAASWPVTTLLRYAVLLPASVGLASVYFWAVERRFLTRKRPALVPVVS